MASLASARLHRSSFSTVSTGLLLLLVATCAEAADTPPPLSEILDHVIDRDAATQRALKQMEYHQSLKIDQLDAHNKITQHQEIQMVVRPGATEEVDVISEKGDSLPANPDQASLKAQGKKFQTQQFNFPLKEMVKRFNITLEGEKMINGQDAYILAFAPKPNQPYGNQTEKVLNQLRGRTFVSTRDYTVLRTDAALAEPVQVAWIFASISALTFHYVLDNPAGMGPAQVETSVQVDAPFFSVRQLMTMDLTQFGPRTKT